MKNERGLKIELLLLNFERKVAFEDSALMVSVYRMRLN